MDPNYLHDRDALVIVDVQRDFCPGGACPVERSDDVIAVINRWIEAAQGCDAVIVLSRDWHPEDHHSFRPQGGPWPPHCVRETAGASFHPALNVPDTAKIVSKGIRSDSDNASPFDQTALAAELQQRGVVRVFVGGLGKDQCVQNTLVDARLAGFEVHLIQDATRPIVLRQTGPEKAEPEEAGVFLDTTDST
jgi:nicotinamidase/pyrazinamidase